MVITFSSDCENLADLNSCRESKPELPSVFKRASLLAAYAGLVHDLGKSNDCFQLKIRGKTGSFSDPIRHEWLSLKLLQAARSNGFSSKQTFDSVESLSISKLKALTLGSRTIDKARSAGLSNPNEIVDFIVATHHGLFNGELNNELCPGSGRHVRIPESGDAESLRMFKQSMTFTKRLDEELFQRLAKLQDQLDETFAIESCKPFKIAEMEGLARLARIAMIFADHSVSMRKQASLTSNRSKELFANSDFNSKGTRQLKQTLEHHLSEVSKLSAETIYNLAQIDTELPSASQEVVSRMLQTAPKESRFDWQNKLANCISKAIQKKSAPMLVLNTAGTGAGKTIANFRAAASARPDNLRIALALNLRSLTLQSGKAISDQFNLGDSTISTLIGDRAVRALFNLQSSSSELPEDEDGNTDISVDYSSTGQENRLPDWISGYLKSDDEKRLIASPILVSTVDYLINAGNPGMQGHYVKASLRLASSDLILDEIDSLDPYALVSVLRLIEMSAFFERNVICSTATLSPSIARAIFEAYRVGNEMRCAMNRAPGHFHVIAADDKQEPSHLLVSPEDRVAIDEFSRMFDLRTQVMISILAQLEKTHCVRRAKLQKVQPRPGHSTIGNTQSWIDACFDGVQTLHKLNKVELAPGKTFSVGLVRIPNIRYIQEIAERIKELPENFHYLAYHADDILFNRSNKEALLDTMLTRKGASPDAHILGIPEIAKLFEQHDDICVLVVASPVEEVGRDHDFDWGFIDLSSITSLVQTVGRINRHRQKALGQNGFNILIPSQTMRLVHSRDKDLTKSEVAPYLVRPGFQDINILPGLDSQPQRESLKKPLAHHLLNLSSNEGFAVDARLKIEGKALLTRLDDEACKSVICNYYDLSVPAGSHCFSAHLAQTKSKQTYLDTQLRNQSSLKTLIKFETDEKGNAQFYALREHAAGSDWIPVSVELVENDPRGILRSSLGDYFKKTQEFESLGEAMRSGCTYYSLEKGDELSYSVNRGFWRKG